MSKDSTQGNNRKDYSNGSTFALIPTTGEIPKLKCGLLKVYSSLIAHSFVTDGKRITKATNGDIGQHIGASGSTVTRAISALGKSGLLQVETVGIVRTIELTSEFSAAGSVQLAFDDPAWKFGDLDFKVYFALRRFKGRNHLAFPTNQTIAKFLGIGLSQVKKGLQGLNSKGVIDSVKYWHGWNKWERQIHFPELPMAKTNPSQNPAIEVWQKTNPSQNPAIEVLQTNPSQNPASTLVKTRPQPSAKPGLNPSQNPAIEGESLRVILKETNTHTAREGQSGGVCGVGDFSISSDEPKPKPEIDQARVEDTISRFKGLYKAAAYLNKQKMIDVIRVLKPKLEKELIPLEFLENCLDEINKETLYPVKVFIRNLDRWDTYDESEKAIFEDKSFWPDFSFNQDIDQKPVEAKNQKPPESGFNGAGRDVREVIAEQNGYELATDAFEARMEALPAEFKNRISEAKSAKWIHSKLWVKVKECEWFIERHEKGLQLPEEENFEPSRPVDKAGQIANKLESVKAKMAALKTIARTKIKDNMHAERRLELNEIQKKYHGKEFHQKVTELASREKALWLKCARNVVKKYLLERKKLEEERNWLIAQQNKLNHCELLNHAIVKTPQPETYYTEKKEIPASNESVNSAILTSEAK